MKGLITICARGGSKGVPGKNIIPISGIPLIGYTIRTAFKFRELYDVDIALSTDSEEISKVALQYGLNGDYKRPAHLGNDNIGKIEVIRHLFNYQESAQRKYYDYVLDLDVTSPLRTVSDLKESLEIILNNKDALNLFSVNVASRNPYFNMVELTKDGFARLVKDGSTFLTRQDSPKVYELNASFYFYKRDFFTKGFNSAITDFSIIYQIPHICFDIDNRVDFLFMEYLLKENLLGFNL